MELDNTRPKCMFLDQSIHTAGKFVAKIYQVLRITLILSSDNQVNADELEC